MRSKLNEQRVCEANEQYKQIIKFKSIFSDKNIDNKFFHKPKKASSCYSNFRTELMSTVSFALEASSADQSLRIASPGDDF